jgi:TolB-like protein/Tfp pilus assembly protein PilF
MPDFGARAREEFGKWFDAEHTEHLLDGVRKAGLEIVEAERAATPELAAASSGTASSPLAAEQHQPATQPPSLPTQSIAVLPFTNISADEENEYFCDGLAEELLNALAKIDDLKVAARTSAFSFKGKNVEAREIGKTLNVNTVLEGSVRKAGNRIRINVQLVNAADGYQLWAERYDREMKDIFDVQDEITLAVVDALKVKLLGAKKAAVLKRYTENTAAYQLYLKGRFQFGKYTEAGWSKAIEYFEQALALESDYAPAHAGVAEACGFLWYFGLDARPEVIARERAAIAKALDIDAELADAWRSQALLQLLIDWDFSAAEQSLARALALNPNDALTHAWHDVWLTAMGRREEAVNAARRARELDPFSLVSGIIAGWTLIFAERYEESMGVAQALLEIDPHFSDAYRLLGCCYWALENYSAAEDALQQALAGEAVPLALANLCGIYAHAGKQAEAQQIVRQIRAMREQHYLPALVLAYCHIFLDEVEEAFVWLEQALVERNAELVYLGAMPERFVSFRHDPRFTDLLRRIGLPTEEPPQTDVSLGASTRMLAPSTSGKPAGAIWTVSSTQPHTVGRERERHELRAAFNVAKGGRGSLLCIAGEPGIGKTTLVEDFLTELTTKQQCTIARGRCSERLAGTEAYLPLLEALESLLVRSTAFRRNDSDDQALPPEGGTTSDLAQTMKQLAPTWYAQVVPLAGDSEEAARLLNEIKAASQERMKRELASFLQAVTEPQPLVLFFDDLHWADVSTIDLLSFLAGKFDALRVLIVTTYRPSDMLLAKHPFLQIKPDLQARGYCRELSLEFLTEAEIADYLTLEFPRHAFPPDFAKLIHAKTEGSPLFMADLVRYLRDRNVIAQSSGSWMLEQTLPDIERELPESVRGMIERKIGQLSEDDRKLLAAASVQGYEFDSAVVAQVLKLEADEVEERLEKLEQVFAFVKLVDEAEFPNRTLTLKYRFVHVLYQNALYASLRATRKATLSREVAQTMECYYGEQRTNMANELAALYEAGREYARAAEYYRLAAEQDTRVSAYQEAVVLARRGLGLLKSEPDTTARTRQELALQIALSLPLGACRGLASQESRELFTRAKELAQQLGDTPELLTIMHGLWLAYLVGADYNKALELGEEFLALARANGPAAMVWAHQKMAAVFTYRGEPASVCVHTKAMLAIWNEQPHDGEGVIYAGENPVAIGLIHSAWSLWNMGYPDQALQQSREALALARQDASPYGLALATFMAAELHISRREHQRVRELADDLLTICAEHGFPQWTGNGYICRGWALVEAGQGAAGVAEMREGITAMHTFGADVSRSRYLALLGEACGAAGQLAEGLSLLAEALAFAEQSGERFFEAEIYRLRGELLLKSEAPQAEVEECFHQAIKAAQRQQAKSLELRGVTSLARLWQKHGKHEEARRMLAEIYGWFTEGFDTADLQEAKALLDELQLQVSTGSVSDSPVESRLPPLQEAHDSEASGRSRSTYRTDVPSIAVLPFVNISNDPDNEYFCDGLAEELIGALSKIEALRVAARTSAFSFKGKETDIREIGQKLNVAAALEGSVRKAGQRIRISVQLVNVADGYHLWSERYDREMKDIFDVQDEITVAVVDALKVKLFGEEQAAILKHHNKNPEAHEFYLRGLSYFGRFTPDGFQKAIESFNRAIAIDARYASAFAGLAVAYTEMSFFSFAPGEWMPKAREAAMRALELDDALGEAHNSLAIIKMYYDWDFTGAEHEFRRALALNPGSALIHMWYGWYLGLMGRFDESFKELRRAQESDPLSDIINSGIGIILHWSRQPERAIEQFRKVLELNPNYSIAYSFLAEVYEQQGDFASAIATIERVRQAANDPHTLSTAGYVYARSGDRHKALEILNELEKRSNQEYVTALHFAQVYAGLGDNEQALMCLDKAYNERAVWMPFLKGDLKFDPLRSDRRFRELLKKVGFPE